MASGAQIVGQCKVVGMERLQNLAKGLRAGKVAALQRAINATLRDGIKLAVRLAPNVSNAGTGSLKRSIRESGEIFNGGLAGRYGSNLVYARIQEFGGIIRAKNGPYLKFKIDGHWVQVRQVYIPPQPYLRPSAKQLKGILTEYIKLYVRGTINR